MFKKKKKKAKGQDVSVAAPWRRSGRLALGYLWGRVGWVVGSFLLFPISP